MRPLLPIAGLLLLGACSLFGPPGPPLPPEDESPDAKACRSEARNSPEVQALARQFYEPNQLNVDRMKGEVNRAQGRAYRDCMRARGHGPQGGVEPQVPR
ncbi:phosphoribosylamine--glycine ligase [Dankookia sp. GCM10030260]|uniref:phosphoribosylamine--glycine ligase n=1 Tax=Dankookia sp. GCM10030260 TaxID=3273390 RepID=UPI00361C07A6